MKFKKIKPILSVVLLLLLFVSCTNGNGNDTTTDDVSTGKKLGLVLDGVAEYSIVRSENASDIEKEASIELKRAIQDYTGVEIKISDDFLLPNASIPEKEILVGRTNREESGSVFTSLLSNDYAIKIVGEKLVILGGDENSTVEAVNQFISKFLSGEKKNTLEISEKDGFTYHDEYPADTFTLNGIDISNFRIVYKSNANNSEKTAAKYLADRISELCGRKLEIVNDRTAATQNEILIGNTTHGQLPVTLSTSTENNAAIAFSDGKLFLAGNNVFSTRYAIDQFISKYIKSDLISDKKIELTVADEILSDIKPTYSAMSFNILFSINQTPERKPLVIDTILNEMPDTVGVQECSVAWMNILETALGEYYDWVGELNNQSQKWYNAIFYRKDKFKLIETKTMWLTATPSVESKIPDSTQFRTVTYAILEDLKTGARFAHYNTHVDYNDDARPVQLKILINQINKCNLPMILTGDLNFGEGSIHYNTLNSTKMKDSKYATDNTMHSNTLNGFGTGNAIIDFCFVTLDTINVSKYRVINELINNQYSSDHFPVYIEFSLSSNQ
ncbi:MAG: hypothetical protein GX303_03990 [Clostridiales bacterium]|nr:hypothetical protein [Clostridiales bacterium]